MNIDDIAYKILVKVYKYRFITTEKLASKLPIRFRANLDEKLWLLVTKDYLANPMADVDKDGNQVFDKNTYAITQNGDVFVEKQKREKRRWLIPIVISGIALVFSALALAINVLSLLKCL